MSELTVNSLEKDSMIKIIDDYKPSLEKLQEMVGGNIEVLTLNNGDTLVTNQDGRMMNLNYNSETTKIFQENTSVKGIDIVGQAVVVKKGWMNIEIETE